MVEIFVFGSNKSGRHGKGAALTAKNKHGARQSCGRGLQGLSYAIPTKGWRMEVLPLDEIQKNVNEFVNFALEQPDWTFNLTPIGTGHAGYTAAQIGPMFLGAPANVIIPKEFKPYV